ncbi:CLUMA_CG000328, isoform A [Clunio marinus]|uniref:CLUMA_CG000328, isoform A n=1 Tax=Clunio marinus TaxID=568069 RepID=A0A1J1HG44_9DIPT|nr:CLUMA_CG000328, isoform A [Clunio marinus]
MIKLSWTCARFAPFYTKLSDKHAKWHNLMLASDYKRRKRKELWALTRCVDATGRRQSGENL